MNCKHCNADNSENWFYCKTCGKKASEPTYTTNLYMGSEIGRRSDIEFSSITMDSNIDQIKKDRAKKDTKFWNNKVKEHRSRYA